MEDNTPDVIEESSTSDVQAESSPAVVEEQTEQVAEPTVQKGTEKVVPYDRFKEINDEKNYWRQHAERLAQQKPVEPQVEVDPYAQFQDPQTKLFYQEMDKRMERLAKKVAEEEKAPIIRQNEILTAQLAQIQHKMYKEGNDDVPEGSPEEAKIAQYVSMGMPIEDATWAVMGKQRVAKVETLKQQKTQQKVEMKAKANLPTTTSVPQQSGLPERKLSFRELMAKAIEDAEA